MNDRTDVPKTEGESPSVRRVVTMIVVVGLLIRISLMGLRWDQLTSDPDAYLQLAASVRNDGGLHILGTTQPTAFRPPLYPLMLAAIQTLGIEPAFSVALLHLAASLVIIPWAAVLAVRMNLRPTAVIAASGLVAMDPLLLQYSTVPMTEVPSAALLTCGLLLFCIAADQTLNRNRHSQVSAFAVAALSGFVFGLSGLTRPIGFFTCGTITAVLFSLIILRPLLHHRRTNGNVVGSAFSLMAQAAIPLIFATLVLIPWVGRNWLAFHTFVPATTHGGYTLLLGNNPVFYEEVVRNSDNGVWKKDSLDAWNDSLTSNMLRQGIVRSDEVQADRWMYERAKQNIREAPTDFLKSAWLRITRFWGITTSSGSSSVVRMAVACWYLAVFCGLLLSLLAPLILRQARQSAHDTTIILWSSIFSFLLIHSFYWTNARMRAPLTVVICVLSVQGWQHFSSAITPRLFRARVDNPIGVQGRSSADD